MSQRQIETEYLYMTAIPVLLDGTAEAGQAAMEIYLRHQITPHWFGRGVDLKLVMYAKRHRLPSPVGVISDEILLQILLDFAAEHYGLLALYPCSPEAVAFVERTVSVLETYYVILSLPESGDPLQRLVRKND